MEDAMTWILLVERLVARFNMSMMLQPAGSITLVVSGHGALVSYTSTIYPFI